MKKLAVLLKYEAKLFSRALIPALLGGALLFMSCFAAAYSYSAGGKTKSVKLTVAVSDEDDTILNRMAIGLVKRQNFIASLIDVAQTDTESALSGVESGKYAAAVILPRGFMDGVFYGGNIPGEVIISESISGAAPVVRSLADLGAQYLSSAQFGVFAGQAALYTLDGGKSLADSYTTRLNMRYIDEVSNASIKYSELSTTGYFGTGTDIASHYALSYMFLFVFLCPLFFLRFASRGLDRSVLARLYSRGVGPGAIIFSKLLFPMLFCALASLVSAFASASFTAFSGDIRGCVLVAAGALFAGAFSMCLFIAVPGKNRAPLFAVALACVGLFLKGALIPPFMLGQAALAAGGRTPFGIAYAFALPAFGGAADKRLYIAGAVLMAVMLLFARRRLKRVIMKGEDGT